jgi:hypothetical protein
VENPLNTRGENHGRQPTTIHYIGSPVTTPMAATYKKRMNQSPMENPSLPVTGLRFAPSEVGLSLGRQNLDHNSTARSARQKTGAKCGVVVEKMAAIQIPSSPLHGGGPGGRSCNSGPRICDDGRIFKVEEMEKTPVIDLCTPTSSESDCVVLKTTAGPSSSSVDCPKRAS